MKTITKFLVAIFMALFTVSMVSSCGDLLKLGNKDGELEYGDYQSGWTEEGNKLIFKQSLNYGIGEYTQVLIFEFKGDECIKATGEFIWPSAILAQAFYEGLDEEEKAKAKVSGTKVTVDFSEDYKGLSKSELKEAIGQMEEWM